MKIKAAALSLIMAAAVIAGASGNISASREAALTVTNIDSTANRLSWESVPGGAVLCDILL